MPSIPLDCELSAWLEADGSSGRAGEGGGCGLPGDADGRAGEGLG